MKRTYQDGVWAETIACWYLRLKGYRILRRRFRTPVGEIDILAARGRTLAVIEVKYRKTLDAALSCVTPRQQQRLERAMHYAVAGLPQYNNHHWRLDLLAIAPRRWPRHIVNAWEGR